MDRSTKPESLEQTTLYGPSPIEGVAKVGIAAKKAVDYNIIFFDRGRLSNTRQQTQAEDLL